MNIEGDHGDLVKWKPWPPPLPPLALNQQSRTAPLFFCLPEYSLLNYSWLKLPWPKFARSRSAIVLRPCRLLYIYRVFHNCCSTQKKDIIFSLHNNCNIPSLCFCPHCFIQLFIAHLSNRPPTHIIHLHDPGSNLLTIEVTVSQLLSLS